MGEQDQQTRQRLLRCAKAEFLSRGFEHASLRRICEAAGVISVLVGFTALIPIFGAFIGVGIGAFLILLVSPIKALWFILFFVILQQLEGNLIYPRVVGKSVGLPGIWVLAAVTVGGNAFGLAGMLLAVPLCSVLYTLARQGVNARLARKGLSS